MITSGIEPATFRFVAQNLNHSAITVPQLMTYRVVLKSNIKIYIKI